MYVSTYRAVCCNYGHFYLYVEELILLLGRELYKVNHCGCLITLHKLNLKRKREFTLLFYLAVKMSTRYNYTSFVLPHKKKLLLPLIKLSLSAKHVNKVPSLEKKVVKPSYDHFAIINLFFIHKLMKLLQVTKKNTFGPKKRLQKNMYYKSGWKIKIEQQSKLHFQIVWTSLSQTNHHPRWLNNWFKVLFICRPCSELSLPAYWQEDGPSLMNLRGQPISGALISLSCRLTKDYWPKADRSLKSPMSFRWKSSGYNCYQTPNSPMPMQDIITNQMYMVPLAAIIITISSSNCYHGETGLKMDKRPTENGKNIKYCHALHKRAFFLHTVMHIALKSFNVARIAFYEKKNTTTCKCYAKFIALEH